MFQFMKNGLDKPATQSSYKLYIPEIAAYSTLPTGTIIIAHRSLLNTTGGNDQ